ncbi:MAG TPA: WD40 repeat domain-containing protein [Stellaceae bacterium]|jgi:WD40 repeat protein|nr:WD40 repeat domain-containing protein [Stellaceae bacterium]
MSGDPASALDQPHVLAPQIWRWRFDAAVTGLVFTRSGHHFGAALGDGTLRIAACAGPSSAPRVVAAHDGAALCLACDCTSDGFLSGGDDGRLVRTGADGTRQTLLHAAAQLIDTIAVTETSLAVALGREVRVLEPGGREAGRTAEHPSTVSGLAFGPKRKRLAVSHYDGVTLWWTASIGATPRRLKYRGSHIGVWWSPDGAYLITATQESELHGWRMADGSDLRMSGYATKVRSLDWVGKPRYLVSGGAESVVAWPFSGSGPAGKTPLELGYKAGSLVTVVAANPARPLLAFAYRDGEVRVADLPRRRIVSIKPPGDGKPASMAWSPDGTALGVGTEDGAACLIDLSRGRE